MRKAYNKSIENIIMTIYTVYCIRKNNGKIVGVGTVHKSDLSRDQYKYWPLSEVFRCQDDDECQIYVTNTETNVNIELTVTKDGEGYVITNPNEDDPIDINNYPNCDKKLEFKKFFET